MYSYLKLFSFILLFSLTNCGSTPTTTVTTTGPTIAIIDFSFIPDTITVDPGDTIFFINEDSVPHQILSESAPDQFDDTGVFDSLLIVVGDVREITIPSSTASGTTLFFYDDFLQDIMLTPNGTITVN